MKPIDIEVIDGFEIRYYIDDDSHESPCEWDDGWKLHSFSSRHDSFTHPNALDLDSIGMRRKIKCGTAFFLSYFEHGNCVWSLRDEGPKCQWDSVRTAGILIWEGSPKDLHKGYEARRESARGFCETYTYWCNGEIYGYEIHEVSPFENADPGEPLDACWGFYGWDDVKQGAKESLVYRQKARATGSATG